MKTEKRQKKSEDLAGLGEFGFIARMSRPFLRGLPAGVEGIGDDCAVLPWTRDEHLLATTDMLVEGRHFIRKSIMPFDLGYKSLSVNLSDIAAMGGRPKWALLSLGVPEGIDLKWLDGFFRGWRTAAKPWDVRLIGGDTTKSPGGLVINVVVFGTVRAGQEKLRSAARIGDVIAVTGTLGDSGGGLKILLGGGAAAEQGKGLGGLRVISGWRDAEVQPSEKVTAHTETDSGMRPGSVGRSGGSRARVSSGGQRDYSGYPVGEGPEILMLARSGEKVIRQRAKRWTPDEMMLVRAHIRPRPHLDEGAWLAGQEGVRAMMDVSDGIDSDVRRIMERSGVGADIDLDKLPVSAELRKVGKGRGFDPVEMAATGGEDYCLLVTVEEAHFDAVEARFLQRFHRPLRAIGVIRHAASGLRYFLRGRPATLRSRGFDHFR